MALLNQPAEINNMKLTTKQNEMLKLIKTANLDGSSACIRTSKGYFSIRVLDALESKGLVIVKRPKGHIGYCQVFDVWPA